MPNVGSSGLYGRDGGTWKPADDVQGHHGGSWALADAVYTRSAGTWRRVWERNTAPGPVTGAAITYVTSGSYSWSARATWTLPADLDLAAVEVQWTIGGVVGSWQVLAANATEHTTAATSGATTSVAVRVVDTGGLYSTTVTKSGGTSPLDAPPSVTVTQVGLDQLQATWTHPAGSRAAYKVVVGSATYYDSASATSRTAVVQPGVATTFTVTAIDASAREGRSRSASGTASAPAPGTPTVSAWSYTSITIAWSHATWRNGGYEVQRAIGNGSFSTVANLSSTTTSYTGSVSEDTDYRYRVRAKGVTYTGSWSGELRPSIGHAAYSVSSPYSLQKNGCNIYKDVADGPTVPGNSGITIDSMGVSLACTFTTSLVSGTATRTLEKGTIYSWVPTGSKPNPWNETFAHGPYAPSGVAIQHGIIARGTGWSSTSSGGYRLTGSIAVYGTQVTNYAAVPNSYW